MTTGKDETPPVDSSASAKTDVDDKCGDAFPSSHAKSIISRDDANHNVIRLNVGGTSYKVSRDTLMRCKGSMLASLISGKWKEGNGNDEIFIDRNGRRFEWILDYLRSDRAYVPDLSDQAAFKDELDYFGIKADMSKVSVTDDFSAIDELTKENKKYERCIEQNKKKIAAMKESYRLVGEFASSVDEIGPSIDIVIKKDVDQELLRGCLMSRGLHTVEYSTRKSGAPAVTICVIGMKKKYDTKTEK